MINNFNLSKFMSITLLFLVCATNVSYNMNNNNIGISNEVSEINGKINQIINSIKVKKDKKTISNFIKFVFDPYNLEVMILESNERSTLNSINNILKTAYVKAYIASNWIQDRSFKDEVELINKLFIESDINFTVDTTKSKEANKEEFKKTYINYLDETLDLIIQRIKKHLKTISELQNNIKSDEYNISYRKTKAKILKNLSKYLLEINARNNSLLERYKDNYEEIFEQAYNNQMRQIYYDNLKSLLSDITKTQDNNKQSQFIEKFFELFRQNQDYILGYDEIIPENNNIFRIFISFLNIKEVKNYITEDLFKTYLLQFKKEYPQFLDPANLDNFTKFFKYTSKGLYSEIETMVDLFVKESLAQGNNELLLQIKNKLLEYLEELKNNLEKEHNSFYLNKSEYFDKLFNPNKKATTNCAIM